MRATRDVVVRGSVLVLVGGTLAGLVGCSSSGPAVMQSDGLDVIGREGGTVSSVDGYASVALEQGTLAWDASFTIEPTGVSTDLAGVVPGTAYEFGPDGAQFAKPVTISIEYDDADMPPGVSEASLRIYKVVAKGSLRLAQSVVDTTANIVTAKTSSFSTYVVKGDGDEVNWQEWFPVSTDHVGSTWVGQVPLTDQYVRFTLAGPASVSNLSGWQLAATSMWDEPLGGLIWRVTSDGIEQMAASAPVGSQVVQMTYDPPVLLPSGPIGTTATTETTARDASGEALGTETVVWTLEDFEDVTVPAGIFEHCVRAKATRVNHTGESDELTIWAAEGMGIVKIQGTLLGATAGMELVCATVMTEHWGTCPTVDPPVLSVSPESLEFGAISTTLDLSIANVGNGPLYWTAGADRDWIELSTTSGKGNSTITVSVDRSRMAEHYTGTITVLSNGGSAVVAVTTETGSGEIVISSLGGM